MIIVVSKKDISEKLWVTTQFICQVASGMKKLWKKKQLILSDYYNDVWNEYKSKSKEIKKFLNKK